MCVCVCECERVHFEEVFETAKKGGKLTKKITNVTHFRDCFDMFVCPAKRSR